MAVGDTVQRPNVLYCAVGSMVTVVSPVQPWTGAGRQPHQAAVPTAGKDHRPPSRDWQLELHRNYTKQWLKNVGFIKRPSNRPVSPPAPAWQPRAV